MHALNFRALNRKAQQPPKHHYRNLQHTLQRRNGFKRSFDFNEQIALYVHPAQRAREWEAEPKRTRTTELINAIHARLSITARWLRFCARSSFPSKGGFLYGVRRVKGSLISKRSSNVYMLPTEITALRGRFITTGLVAMHCNGTLLSPLNLFHHSHAKNEKPEWHTEELHF